MDCLSFFVLLAVVVTVFGVWLYRLNRRLRAAESRLDELDRASSRLHRTLARVRGDLAQLRPDAPPPPVTAGPTTPFGSPPRATAAEEIPAATAEPAAAKEPLPEEEVPSPADRLPPSVEAAPPPVEAAPPAAEIAAPAVKRIDWERWIGVRGAAVAGAVVLALAGLLFLKYSIEQGLIPPPVRVAAGILAGLGCLAGSESLRRRPRGYEATADALAGAGVVLLYAAVWAARALYALIGPGFSFVLMVLVTLACGALAWFYDSRVIAVLGLVGGFATPALLTGLERPIGLFGYLVLLNLGVLALAVRRGWPQLAALSLAATFLYQAFWIFGRMESQHLLLGVAVAGLFAVVYALAPWGTEASPPQERRWRQAQAAAVFLPFAFTVYFAANAELGPHLYPLGALLLLLSLLAQWIGRQQAQPLFGVAGAVAALTAVLVWCLRADFDLARQWQAAATGVALALAFHLPWELALARRRAGADGAGVAAGEATAERISALGFLLLAVGVPLAISSASPWPWLAAWTVLAVLLWRQSAVPGGKFLPLLASLAVGAGGGLLFLVQARDRPAPVLLYVLAAAVACQLGALRRRDPEGRRWAEIAAVVLPLALNAVLAHEAAAPTLAAWMFYATTLAAAALAVLAATRLASGGFYFAALAILAVDHGLWSAAAGPATDTAALALGFAAQVLAVAAATAWPFVAGAAFRAEPWAWYAAALAAPAWFLSLRHLFVLLFGTAAIGLLPLVLAAMSLAAAARSRRRWAPSGATGRGRLAWFAAVALGFVSVAIPLQLDQEWITLGWALEGLAVLVLWRRLDHPGLKYFGLLLLFAASVRLVLNPAVVGYHPAAGWPLLNWLLYTYLVPAAALVFSARLLATLEVARQRPFEEELYRRGWPVAAAGCGVAAVLVVFVWINLAIFDFFSPGGRLLVSLDRLPARDLTLSLAWAAYALLLLALGMARGIRALRWISLGFLVLALIKVFLHDLGELTDLYRVASLVGLAVSLLVVSLAYQRFVFGRRPTPGEDP